jgi:hypothetical protein
MPIVVDEVVISVDVGNEGGGGGRAPAGGGGGGSEADRQQIVNECIERVLEILAQREER